MVTTLMDRNYIMSKRSFTFAFQRLITRRHRRSVNVALRALDRRRSVIFSSAASQPPLWHEALGHAPFLIRQR